MSLCNQWLQLLQNVRNSTVVRTSAIDPRTMHRMLLTKFTIHRVMKGSDFSS